MSNFIKNFENDLKALTRFLVGPVKKEKSTQTKKKKKAVKK